MIGKTHDTCEISGSSNDVGLQSYELCIQVLLNCAGNCSGRLHQVLERTCTVRSRTIAGRWWQWQSYPKQAACLAQPPSQTQLLLPACPACPRPSSHQPTVSLIVPNCSTSRDGAWGQNESFASTAQRRAE